MFELGNKPTTVAGNEAILVDMIGASYKIALERQLDGTS